VRTRTSTAALLTAAALVLTPMAGAVAEDSTTTAPGVTKSEVAKAKAKARKLERSTKTRGALVLGGTVTAVDAAAGTLSFTVHGGRYKVLRKQTLTVDVAPDAKVTRDGVVTLAEVLAGDHVVVKAWRFDFTLAEPAPEDTTATVTVTLKAHRVAASAPDAAEDTV
jgi:hypothetical protein